MASAAPASVSCKVAPVDLTAATAPAVVSSRVAPAPVELMATASGVTLDVGLISPQTFGHLRVASLRPRGAAEEYVRTICARAVFS